MLVVADSSAIIALAVCDGLDVILQVYDDLKIPEAVYREIVAPESLLNTTRSNVLEHLGCF